MKNQLMVKGSVLLALAAALVGCGGGGGREAGGPGFDWPAWRGPAGDGISKETAWNPAALAGNPTVAWQVDVGLGYSSVAIQDNLLVTAGTTGGSAVIWGFRADNGKQVWKYSCEDYDDSQATPVIAGQSVYALNRSGKLFCLNASNGKLRWKKDLVADYGVLKPYYGFAGSPVIREDLVILTANTAGMALNKKNGKMVWASEPPPKQFKTSDRRDTNGADYATPVVYDRQGKTHALFASWKGVSAVEAQSGQPLWVYEWELYTGRHVSDPVVIDGRIFIAENSTLPYQPAPGCLLLDASSAQPAVLWSSPELATEISTPVVIDGYAYCGQGGPELGGVSLRCLDLDSGKLMWEKKLSEAVSPKCVTVSAADGKLIVLTDEGLLAIAEASAEAYWEISRYTLLPEVEAVMKKFWTPPVLCNGRIYCRNYNGHLVCIDVSE